MWLFVSSPQAPITEVVVRVTWLDIILGTRSDANYCPLARAMSRALGRRVTVWSGGWVYTIDPGPMQPFADFVGEAIGHFDRHERMRPMTFSVRP